MLNLLNTPSNSDKDVVNESSVSNYNNIKIIGSIIISITFAFIYMMINQSSFDINTFLETSITKIEGLGPYAYLYFAAVSIYMYYKSTFCSSFFK
jgi:hypothetical protein